MKLALLLLSLLTINLANAVKLDFSFTNKKNESISNKFHIQKGKPMKFNKNNATFIFKVLDINENFAKISIKAYKRKKNNTHHKLLFQPIIDAIWNEDNKLSFASKTSKETKTQYSISLKVSKDQTSKN